MPDEPKPAPDRAAIREFLELAHPGGPWVLTAIPVEGGRTATETFRDAGQAAGWAEAQNALPRNVYWTVNRPRGEPDKKPKKEDIEEALFLHVDADPRKGEDVETERARILAELNAHRPAPTIIVDSGGGYQGLWRLDEPLYIGGTAERWTDLEAYNRQLQEVLGGDNCFNVDRILRVAGTVNWPDEKKLKKGRRARRAMLAGGSGEAHPLHDFTPAPDDCPKARSLSTAAVTLPGNIPLADLDLLPDGLDARARMLIAQGDDPDDPARYGSKSEAMWFVACELVRAGCDNELIAAVLLDPDLPISAHCRSKGKKAREYTARQIERAREAVARAELDPSGRRVLDPAAPFATAKRLHGELFPNAVHTNDDFLEYDRGAYRAVEDATMRSAVWEALDAATVRKVKDDAVVFVPFKPGPGQVSGVLDALKAVAHQPADRMAPPVWLDGDGPPPGEIISCRNGLLHVPTGELLPPTPRFFTRNALSLDFDPGAPEPRAWTDFVREVLPDEEAAALLQEWFGYFLLPDTSQEKMLLLVGPPRSGKGTIQKVLTELVGLSNVCAPSIKSLGGDFGLQPMIGKQVAFLSDIRIGSGSDRAAITETLLRITGRDDVTANRKHKEAWTGRLGVRFFIATNEMPSLSDNSPALANRFVPLILERSFLGREDHGLAERLVAELPGILNWSLAGWRRLRGRGHFVLPEASTEAIGEIVELGSPVAAFVRDLCEVAPGRQVEKDRLYATWQRWCEANKLMPGRVEHFARSLRAATSHRVDSARPTIEGQRTYVFEGIALVDDGGRGGAGHDDGPY